MEKKEEFTQVYEVGYHIVPAVAIENLPKEVENLKDFLVKEGAAIVSEEFPKMRDLSYLMSRIIGGTKRRFDTAYFGWIKFDAREASMTKIKKFLDENENILRFLLIKTVRESTLFSPIPPKTQPSPNRGEPAGAIKKGSMEKEIKSIISQEELDKTIDKLIAE